MEVSRPRSQSQKFFALIGTLFIFYSTAFADSNRQAYVISLQNQMPENLIPVVEPLLAEGDGVTGFGNELIITTDAQRIANIRTVIGQIDKPLKNLLIQVRNNDSGNNANQQQGFSGGIQQGHITIGTGTPPARGEGVTVSSDGLSYSMHQNNHSYTTRSEQQIRAIEGQAAFLYTGQSIKLPSQDRHGDPYTVEADALRGVYVTAHLNGDRVQLDISTSNDSLKDSHHKQILINTQQLSTHVSGKVGEWINLGGLSLSGAEGSQNQVKKITTNSNSLGNISVKIQALD